MHRTTGDGNEVIGGKRQFVDQVLPGTPGTIVEKYWMNSAQEEICNVVEGAGLTLASDGPSDTRDQLYTAIFQSQKLSANALEGSSVTNPKIALGAVTTNKIGVEQVTESRIGGSAVTESRLANGAVSTNKIVSGNVVRDHAKRESEITTTGWTPVRMVRKRWTIGSDTVSVTWSNIGQAGKEVSRLTGVWVYSVGPELNYAPLEITDFFWIGSGDNLTVNMVSLDNGAATIKPPTASAVVLRLFIEYHPDELN